MWRRLSAVGICAAACLPTGKAEKVAATPTAAALTVSAMPSGNPGEASVSVDLVAIDENGNSYAGVMSSDVSFDAPTDTTGSPAGSAVGSPTCQSMEYKNTERSASVVLLMDQSGSIMQTDPEDLRIRGGKEFLHSMSSGSDVLLMSFADGNPCAGSSIQTYGSFTKDPKSVEASVDSLAGCAGGGTPLWQASVDAISRLESGGSNRSKALVIFTDGADSSFMTTVDDVIAAATQKEIRIFTVGLSDGVELAVLSQVAQATGGAFFFARDVGSMISAFRGMNLLLTGDYDRNSCKQTIKLPSTSPGTTVLMSAHVKVNGVQTEAPIAVQIMPGTGSGGTTGGSASSGGSSPGVGGSISFAGTGGTSGGARP